MEVRVLSWAPNSKGRCNCNGLFLFPRENLRGPLAGRETQERLASTPRLRQAQHERRHATRLASPPTPNPLALNLAQGSWRRATWLRATWRRATWRRATWRRTGTTQATAHRNHRIKKKFRFFLLGPKTPFIIRSFLRCPDGGIGRRTSFRY